MLGMSRSDATPVRGLRAMLNVIHSKQPRSAADAYPHGPMSILVNAQTRVICQGITGAYGAQHTQGCYHYGTKLVGGVTPGKGGTKDANGLPVFDTVEQAVRETGATATMIFVPPGLAGDAILE